MANLIHQLLVVATGMVDPENQPHQWSNEHLAILLKKAAEQIEYLEREVSEEKNSREVASQKAWEFADRIRDLEAAFARIDTLLVTGDPPEYQQGILDAQEIYLEYLSNRRLNSKITTKT